MWKQTFDHLSDSFVGHDSARHYTPVLHSLFITREGKEVGGETSEIVVLGRLSASVDSPGIFFAFTPS